MMDDGRLNEAAERIARVRHAWGWHFHRHPKVMAIDLLMAEAALGGGSVRELEQQAAMLEEKP